MADKMHLCTFRLTFVVFASLISPSMQIKVISTLISCNNDWRISATYVLADKSPDRYTYKVVTCIPSYKNFYCNGIKTMWTDQTCTARQLTSTTYAINCNVVTPDHEPGTAYKSFGLKMTIRKPVGGQVYEEMVPVTPVLVCDVDSNGRKKIKPFKKNFWNLKKEA